MGISQDELERLHDIAKSNGLQLAAESAVSIVRMRGFELPATFLWFCSHHRCHNGWPHLPTWQGLFSPMGSPSPLELEDAARREDTAWPVELVSFFGTDDGAYCFSYSNAAEPCVVYVDDFANPPADGEHVVDADFQAVNWLEWFSSMTQFCKDRS